MSAKYEPDDEVAGQLARELLAAQDKIELLEGEVREARTESGMQNVIDQCGEALGVEQAMNRHLERKLLAWRELGRDLMSYDINAGDARPRIAALLEGGPDVS